ncbi:AsmA family protein [Sphingomonas crusticola]|uniref:AsmA family protein n=1 Tax=Sphingomonas crusticola TaxID=1697973 RepID=UPI000E243FD2|nr:AsmA-like C-terminal region-containing protein [Sphingomonas crusticola]
MDVPAFFRRHRRVWYAVGGTILALLLIIFLILSYGWAYLRGPLEQSLSRQFGRAVTVGALDRIDHGFLQADLRIRDIRVAQPEWAGGGDMIVIRSALVRLPIIPLMFGQARPHSLEVDGLTIALLRQDPLHANWKGFGGGGKGGGGSLQHLTIRNGLLTLDDRKRNHRFTAPFMADDQGLRLAGRGSLAGNPSTIALTGAALTGNKPWPFRFDYRSAIANGTLIGRADHPLDLGHFDARATAWGDDLRHLDLLIEAGLPGTQPVRLTANLRHDRADWAVRKLDLRLGRSALAGDVTVAKRDGRTRVDGNIVSTGLDFDDLASNEGLARAAAKRKAIGPRIFPDTAIHLEHMQRTDGTIDFDIKRLLFKQPSTFRALRGTLTLDHGVLTAKPLVATLGQGRLTGMARVRHQSGTPRLTLDLRVGNARLEAMLGDLASGALAARIHLEGSGRTVRAAIGQASGTIGVVGRNGAVNRRAALLLGSDAGRALFEDKSDKAALRCLIARFDMKGGIATAAPLLLDTDVSRTQGKGTINLATERLGLTLSGQPKLKHAVRLPIPIIVSGSLSEPKVVPQSVPKTVGTVFKLIGNAIAGPHVEPAPDADCAGLAAQALR